mmetsp:Transcript_93305/g.216917  ORF Transcript_93305/g.216917 Transcript_93305/m.216917 type:complete len:157 (+) Transcript_93305:65-535(+)|eukprot:CAMPEP_0171061618 /NCGR_PEP_ID=MMETSP0766_2-20121228/4555_1 /TAXON_ID=439317 /ORGANISM="Gambierdiscus australes, Strain CAWD 149" /LENGTH=156 /DNA_ID=CAMNT_0011517323 /DNA_START=57 /DNA_END=527 /DNA_ORIENTATION=-
MTRSRFESLPEADHEVAEPDIEPPPNSPLWRNAASEVKVPAQELPKPKIAYHLVQGDATREQFTRPAVNPMVRYCVFCGMRVAPQLITARFCVYCGNVHSGEGSMDASPQLRAAAPAAPQLHAATAPAMPQLHAGQRRSPRQHARELRSPRAVGKV